MSYKNLLNAVCKIERISASSAENEFNEKTEEPSTIADKVPCRLEKLYDRELVEAYGGGDHDKGIYCLYLDIGINIRGGDLVTVHETVKVNGFSNTAVNGIYIRSEDTQVNDNPVYILDATYRISFNGVNWVIENYDTPEELYKTSGTDVTSKVWALVNGTGTTGKSKLRIISDFHYNSSNRPNLLIVNDVEDAGGGQGHHLQCFCRYRKGLE